MLRAEQSRLGLRKGWEGRAGSLFSSAGLEGDFRRARSGRPFDREIRALAWGLGSGGR